jgi:hypothetical protein
MSKDFYLFLKICRKFDRVSQKLFQYKEKKTFSIKWYRNKEKL